MPDYVIRPLANNDHEAVIDLIDHGLMSQPGFKAAFDEAPPQLAQWAVDQLTRVGVARWDGLALQSCA